MLLGAYLASSADFAGADDIITNFSKEREPGIEIVTSSVLPNLWLLLVVRGKDSLSTMTPQL